MGVDHLCFVTDWSEALVKIYGVINSAKHQHISSQNLAAFARTFKFFPMHRDVREMMSHTYIIISTKMVKETQE